jgi:hypothetical protein
MSSVIYTKSKKTIDSDIANKHNCLWMEYFLYGMNVKNFFLLSLGLCCLYSTTISESMGAARFTATLEVNQQGQRTTQEKIGTLLSVTDEVRHIASNLSPTDKVYLGMWLDTLCRQAHRFWYTIERSNYNTNQNRAYTQRQQMHMFDEMLTYLSSFTFKKVSLVAIAQAMTDNCLSDAQITSIIRYWDGSNEDSAAIALLVGLLNINRVEVPDPLVDCFELAQMRAVWRSMLGGPLDREAIIGTLKQLTGEEYVGLASYAGYNDEVFARQVCALLAKHYSGKFSRGDATKECAEFMSIVVCLAILKRVFPGELIDRIQATFTVPPRIFRANVEVKEFTPNLLWACDDSGMYNAHFFPGCL